MIKELIKLTRFEHAIMLAFAVLIAETIVLGTIPAFTTIIILSLLVPIFSEMGSFALNDYFDIETDRINKKTDRPLVNGTISPKFALYFSIISILSSVLFAYFINLPAFVIALVFNLFAVIYNWRLKDIPLIGNIYIATTMAVPFIFGNFVVTDNISIIALALAALGFVAGLAREIIKSVQDVKGDKKARNSRTLPIVIGEKKALWTAIILYMLFIPLSAVPFTVGLEQNNFGIILVVAADILILLLCYRLATKCDYKFARNMSLIAFMLGMAGFFVANM